MKKKFDDIGREQKLGRPDFAAETAEAILLFLYFVHVTGTGYMLLRLVMIKVFDP